MLLNELYYIDAGLSLGLAASYKLPLYKLPIGFLIKPDLSGVHDNIQKSLRDFEVH